MITSVYFENFKVLEDFSVQLKDFNILVGINNCGKSTILDAFRILNGAYRYASRLNPQIIQVPGTRATLGWRIPDSSIPIILDNISTNFSDTPSRIRYRFGDHKNLYIHFEKDSPVKLTYDTNSRHPTTASSFRKEFKLNLSIIPTLGPFEFEEDVLDPQYLNRSLGSRRSSRMFRNIWYQDKTDFKIFQDTVKDTWPGMNILFPEKPNPISNKLFMFYEENRIPREICWAGYGFQIWLQLLTHIIKNKDSDILVVDEPEIYLHPDLQHRILELLKSIPARVILATHSVEIINEAEPYDVLIVDRLYKSAKRLSDISGLQIASEVIGSNQNINLTRLARGKRILFVEGNDSKILSKLAKIAGYDNLFEKNILTVIPIDGFSQHHKIGGTYWAFSKILKEQIKLSAVFDRDYRCCEETDAFIKDIEKDAEFIHVLSNKEIENYLLVPKSLEKTIQEKIDKRKALYPTKVFPDFNIYQLLNEISDPYKALVIGQIASHRYKFLKQSGCDDLAIIIVEEQRNIENNWNNLDYRLSRIPGKNAISSINSILQERYGISVTTNNIISNMTVKEIDRDLICLFEKIKKFNAS